jgi:hypothetical protein
MMFVIPEEAWTLIGSYLSAPDVLSLITTCTTFHNTLGKSITFWWNLHKFQSTNHNYDTLSIQHHDHSINDQIISFDALSSTLLSNYVTGRSMASFEKE